jgi:carbamoyltransferase
VNVNDFFDVASLRRDCGLFHDAIVHFYNHHLAHALPTVFYTEWSDALDAAPIRARRPQS